MRMAEFGRVHRHERSGVTQGLFRVRTFVQDDAHIYCTEEQIESEILAVLKMVKFFYTTFGFTYHVELSTRPEKRLGSEETWDKAENSLKNALESAGETFKVNPGDGAFYGPKIDFHLKILSDVLTSAEPFSSTSPCLLVLAWSTSVATTRPIPLL